MITLIIAALVSVALAFLALEVTLRIDPLPDPLPLEGWTP